MENPTANAPATTRPAALPDSDTLAKLVQKLAPEIARALPKHVNPDRMGRIVTTALRTVPKLAATTPTSFLGCVIQCAQLGLEPCTPLGHAYLIPRWSGKRQVNECTLIVGYKGLIELARRSGQVSNVYAYSVRVGDSFAFQLGTDRSIQHVPSDAEDRESKPITHVYAVAIIRGGQPEFQVLTKAQVEARRARSSAAGSGPWVTDWEAMALKSAVRALAPWIPQSAEFARAVALEDAAERGSQLAQLDDETKAVLLSGGVAEHEDFAGADAADAEVEPAAAPDPVTQKAKDRLAKSKQAEPGEAAA